MKKNEPKTFYRVFVADGFGVAFSPPETSTTLIPFSGEITSWEPLELVIKPGEWEGPPGDFVHSDIGGMRICSNRLKDLLEDLCPKIDKVQWLPVYVTDLAGKREECFILYFPEPPDVLNMDPGETICDAHRD